MFFLFTLALAAYFGLLAAWLITLAAKLPGPITRGIFLTILLLVGISFAAGLYFYVTDAHDALQKEEYSRIQVWHHFALALWLPLGLLWLFSAITFISLTTIGLRKVGPTFRASHWPQARLLWSAITSAFIAAFIFQALDRAKKIELTQQASIARAELRQILQLKLPANENAWLKYQEISKSLNVKDHSSVYRRWAREVGEGDFERIYTSPTAKPLTDAVERIVREARIASALPKREVDFQGGNPHIEIIVRNASYEDAKLTFGLLRTNAYLNAKRGKRAEAIRSLCAMQQMSVQWTTELDQYAYYYALEFQEAVCVDLSRMLSQTPFTEAELKLLPSFSAAHTSQRMSETVAFEQRRDRLKMAEDYLSDNFMRGDYSPLEKWWLKNLLDLERVFLSQTDLETAWSYHQDWQSVSGLRSFELLTQVDKIKQKQKSRYLGQSTTATTIGYDKMCRAIIQFEAMSHVTQLGIAAYRYHLQHGHYPAALTDLAQADPTLNLIDPFTNVPLKLLRKHNELIIYSVGPDRKDDGGLSYSGYGNNFDLLFKLRLPTLPPTN